MKDSKDINNFDLIMALRKIEVGEEITVNKHRIKRTGKYTYKYVCPCCSNKSIAYGKGK